ncbi:MAG: tetratricopeptide repeat protein [Planctomycetota bacterium]
MGQLGSIALALVLALGLGGPQAENESEVQRSAESPAASSAPSPAEANAGEGAVLWRQGDQEAAVEVWRSALEQAASAEDGPATLDPRERARLAYNIGVAEHRSEKPLRAAAWFEAALRLAPRWESARVNRDLARADAGLEPRDEGIVGTFIRRFTRGEAGWLALGGGLLLALAGALDALRGGGWRRAPWLVLLGLPILWTPLLGHLAAGDQGRVMVVAKDGAALYGAPDAEAERLGKLGAGEETLLLDELPGWVKILDRGEERWAPEESVLSVIR